MNIEQCYYRFINIPSGDIRISITDSCNMNCFYCHNEGQSQKNNELTVDQITYLVENSLKYGVNKVRITGGEPLIHKDIYEILSVLRTYPQILNLGINTNAYEKEKLIHIAQNKLVDQIVVGIDCFSGSVSKYSSVGPSPKEVLETVLFIRNNYDVKIEIDSVLAKNQNQTFQLVEWAINNGVLIKVLEMTTDDFKKEIFDDFIDLCKRIYNLSLGKDIILNELYLFDKKTNEKKIIFYHSHCCRRDCGSCKYMHLRVSANGFSKPCLLREDTQVYLLKDFDSNICKTISLLGKSPEENIEIY